jgi:Uma2 family endonuclease
MGQARTTGELEAAAGAGRGAVVAGTASGHLIPVEEYLATELDSPIKREYVGGRLYPRAETTNAHNIIAGNVLVALHSALLSKGCQPYNSDTKIRIRFPSHVRFYYPDALAVCRSNGPDDAC